MTVAASAVKEWFASACPNASISRIASDAGIPRLTLHQQLVRDRVQETTVVAVARSLSLPPLQTLAFFEPYADLQAMKADAREVLAFIDWPELLVAVGKVYRGAEITEADLGRHLFPDSSRVWVDAIDTGTLRKSVEETQGMVSSNMAGALRGVLKAPLAVSFARHAGTPVSSALVVAGVLTPMEAGWDPDERKQALLARSTTELLKLVGIRAAAAEKHARRIGQFEENLG